MVTKFIKQEYVNKIVFEKINSMIFMPLSKQRLMKLNLIPVELTVFWQNCNTNARDHFKFDERRISCLPVFFSDKKNIFGAHILMNKGFSSY